MMLDWTGERFVPWADAPAVAYEHLHRYYWVSEIVKHKRVLDLASGEGYGSNVLAGHALSVVGVDIDEPAVRHASEKYVRPNLQFLRGSVTNVPIAENNSFDVIVCFEVIEHIAQHEEILQEVKRLLKKGGVFVVSTPNKDVYSGEGAEHNPYHVRELSFEELDELLKRYFTHMSYFGQRVLPASSLWPLASTRSDGVLEFDVARGEAEFERISLQRRVGAYFIAVASDDPASESEVKRLASVLIDHSNALGSATEKAIEWKDGQIRELNAQVQELNQGLEWTRGNVKNLEQTVASKEEALAWRADQVADLERKVGGLEGERNALRELTEQTQRQLGAATQELAEIHQSRGWKAVLKARRLLGFFR